MVVQSKVEICCVRLAFVIASLVGDGGGLVCESVGTADLLSDYFDSRQFTFAFMFSEVRQLLLDLDDYGGPDLLRMFPFY